MVQVADTLAEKRHARAETELLRVFFLRWCEMHRRIADEAESMQARQQAAQELTEQAHKLKEFYG